MLKIPAMRRLLEQRPDLRVLYTSGYTENTNVHADAIVSRIGFLQKPYVMQTLLEKTREMLDGP
jgi:hypothetical protein